MAHKNQPKSVKNFKDKLFGSVIFLKLQYIENNKQYCLCRCKCGKKYTLELDNIVNTLFFCECGYGKRRKEQHLKKIEQISQKRKEQSEKAKIRHLSKILADPDYLPDHIFQRYCNIPLNDLIKN